VRTAHARSTGTPTVNSLSIFIGSTLLLGF
jgi:hypothetical protein